MFESVRDRGRRPVTPAAKQERPSVRVDYDAVRGMASRLDRLVRLGGSLIADLRAASLEFDRIASRAEAARADHPLRRRFHTASHPSARPPGSRPRPGWRSARIWTILALVGFFVLLGLFTGVLGALAVYRSYVADFVPPDQVAINHPSLGAKIYDRNGRLLYEYLDDRDGLRQPVKLDAIARTFLAATIATEDRTFFDNPGVSIPGLARAAWENFSPLGDTPGFLEGSGGSSITQQLIKNVYIPPDKRSDRSLDRKLKESIYAIELTSRYSKDQILEWYVNQISYGSVYNGVEAASQGYFAKPAGELTLSEAALLAGIPQSPAKYDPRNNPEQALERRNGVLDLMLRTGHIRIGADDAVAYTTEEIEAAKAEPLTITEHRFPILAPHFVLTYVQPQLERIFGADAAYRQGLRVYTTLDIELQDEAAANLERWIREFENSSQSRNGALIVIEPASGEIRVMLGSRDYFREDIQGTVNNLLALNSPGSSFKPFVYLTSMLKLGWGPGTILQDTPVVYREANGTIFQPQNPVVNSYQGNISLRNALGNSLNVPAFKTAQAIGVSDVVAAARRYGFTTLTGYYGPAIAIGGVDVAAIDLAYGYSMLANGGTMVGLPVEPKRPGERALDPIAISRVEDSSGNVVFDIQDHRKAERIVEEEYAYLMSQMLADPRAVCITFGCGGLNIPGYSVAVKTGTSSPFDPAGPNANKIGETWAFGYTRDYVVGVWAGNANNAPVVNIFSTSISFRAMRDTMLSAYDGRPQTQWAQPANVDRRRSCITAQPVPGQPEPAQTCTEELYIKVPAPFFVTGQAAVVPTAEPTQRPADSGISISSPGGGNVSGVVGVFGSANSSKLQFYRLEFGRGADPQSWTSIGQWSLPITAGQLAAWDTTPLVAGVYSLRLTVQDGARGPMTASVTVNVIR